MNRLTNHMLRFHRRATKRVKYVLHKFKGQEIVHFLHVGKTGGSAVKYALKDHINTPSNYAIYVHPHKTTLRDVHEGEKVIFFLRNPVSRFTSGFYSRQRQGQPRHFTPWTKDERSAFEYFTTANQLALALSSTDKEVKGRAEIAMKSIRHVKDTFWNWFESREYFMHRLPDVYFVGFQETLSEDFEVLKAKLDLPKSVVLPTDSVCTHRTPDDLPRGLEKEAVNNLQSWYARDFEFLELCKMIAAKDRGSYVIQSESRTKRNAKRHC